MALPIRGRCISVAASPHEGWANVAPLSALGIAVGAILILRPACGLAGILVGVAPDLLQGRPAAGVGHYLRDIVYGANDGVVTTLAVIAGVTGASLAPGVALVLGLANLVGDGFSMGVGNYLSLKSELAQRGIPPDEERPARHGAATFLAFALAGGVPLLAYAIPDLGSPARFAGALALAAITLAAVGAWRAPFVKASRTRSVAEMVGIGGLAAAGAYAVGAMAHRLVAM